MIFIKLNKLELLDELRCIVAVTCHSNKIGGVYKSYILIQLEF